MWGQPLLEVRVHIGLSVVSLQGLRKGLALVHPQVIVGGAPGEGEGQYITGSLFQCSQCLPRVPSAYPVFPA